MTLNLRRMHSAIATYYQSSPIAFWVRVLVVAAVAIVFLMKRSFWTPDTLFIVMLALFVVFGRARAFLKRFVPFIGLLLVYDSFRGIADNLNHYVHFQEMIDFDLFVFGGVLPTEWLQQQWWHGSVQWYDFYFYFLYTMHFVTPVILALLIWWKRDSLYWPYMWGFVLLSFAGFVTYVVFPAAPPWMAAEHGLIAPIHRISSDIWYAMGITNFSEVYSKLSPNEVAAVPSLHAAYPTLLTLFAGKAFGFRRLWWLWLYPASIWLGIVYLGEHYVVDALLGALYAYGAYRGVLAIAHWKRAGGFARMIDERAHAWGFAFGQRVRHLTMGR